jgi:hypothetical protein
MLFFGHVTNMHHFCPLAAPAGIAIKGKAKESIHSFIHNPSVLFISTLNQLCKKSTVS